MTRIGPSAAGPGRPDEGLLGKRPAVRQGLKVLLDAGLAALAWAMAAGLLQGGPPGLRATGLWVAFAMAWNLAFAYTRQHFRLLGLLEARALLAGSLAMVPVLLLLSAGGAWLDLPLAPRAQLVMAALLTPPLWLGLRLAAVALEHRRSRLRHARRGLDSARGTAPRRTLIVGAGRAGAALCQELRMNPELGAQVLGFVDDALEKQGVRIQGIPVLGHSRLLPVFLQEQRAEQVILAMPSAPGSRIKELSELLRSLGVPAKTVPGLTGLMGDTPWKPELRDIAIEDLLRREPIHLDLGSIRQEIEGAVVLITGAGGSIGSELARQIAPFRPGRIVLLGRGENSLWEAERELRGRFPGLELALELCDIRNPRRLRRAFEAWGPRIVFHAAAHKHVPFLERHPEEGLENNVLGTLNVLRAALDAGTRTFVNISTDKAVNPTSVLGVTKRIAEYLVLQAAKEAPEGCRFVSVRFGNVLGSRGSVIPLFREQIRRGGPITVTHPEMTRYFMTIPEASQLVLQAGILGRTGKVFVLDMGAPVRIVDMAMDMARLSGLSPGVDIDIQFTGVRPGEKLHEELFTDSEQRESDVHAKVFEAVQRAKDPVLLDLNLRLLEEALDLPEGVRQRQMLRCFRRLVPSYQPSSLGLGRHGSGAAEPTGEAEEAPALH